MDFGPREARELLAFYRDAGADALLAEEAIDRMADPAAAAFSAEGLAEKQPDESKNPRSASSITVRSGAPARNEARNISQQPTLPPPDVAAMAAREAATNAKDLDELRAILENFQGCGLRGTATQLVFADGNPQARVMFVGEAPGYEEDISGRPFVGRSGKLLDRMMEAISLDRSKAYIANVVPWRPPGNRTPTPQETAICLPFIRRQIELADPDILVCLGQPATHARPLVQIRHRQARNSRYGHASPRLPSSPAAAEATRLAGFSGAQKGAELIVTSPSSISAAPQPAARAYSRA
jgi:DNA polymerase